MYIWPCILSLSPPPPIYVYIFLFLWYKDKTKGSSTLDTYSTTRPLSKFITGRGEGGGLGRHSTIYPWISHLLLILQ